MTLKHTTTVAPNAAAAATVLADSGQAERRTVWSLADGEPFALGSTASTAQELADDASALDACAADGKPVLRLRRRLPATGQAPVLKLYESGSAAPLSTHLAILERFGLCVQSHQATALHSPQTGPATLHAFTLVSQPGARVDVPELWPLIESALNAAWNQPSEHDALCSLVVRIGLTWSQVTLLRAFGKYLKQIGFPMSDQSAAAALADNQVVAQKILAAFYVKFDPQFSVSRAASMEAAGMALRAALADVVSPEAERVLRKHAMLLDALVRTNYFQHDRAGNGKDYVSFKIDARAIDELPAPRPQFEVFVYAAHMEGIHLRGGRVSRGGIRWSDRHDDYRTEIHGLLKAQMVKNVVIVPEGSKGGFIVKRAPVDASLEGRRRNAIACYETLIRGLLDITDNIVEGQIVRPPEIICHDENDPYLVVAADKGTATFSDAANALSAEYGFWLDDAFASGGSVGYDHKKMGITARGAWESVRRHFAEIGTDVQRDPISVIAVGDMSGDVFGNGMLLSRQIRLLGAFDHRHIFIDPAPDAGTSFNERQRLFNLPHSSWADYDTVVLSQGGEVYDRRAKTLHLSEQATALLGLASAHATPDEVILALLTSAVDLLWLGGIGTYIKASGETDDQVGDRSCDLVRVNGRQLRCKVIAEGANLGITQLGRIEYALQGGKLNTDAIDNAGGVNCSDHEVNIKILLRGAERAGLITRQARNALLQDMTDEVAALVLRDNYLQSQALSVALASAPAMLLRHQSLIRRFERSDQLDRAVAGLPDDETIAQRKAAGIGLTRPELAVLLAHTKISLFREICASDLPDDPLFVHDLLDYFPACLRQPFEAQIQQHPLKREIIATTVVNNMVNRVGSGFVDQLQGQTGASDAAVARAYAAVREVFDLQRFWSAVEAMDGSVPSAVQTNMHLDSRRLAEAATLWVMRSADMPDDLTAWTAHLRAGVQQVQQLLGTTLAPDDAAALTHRASALAQAGAPPEVAGWAASLPELHSALDIVSLADGDAAGIGQVARMYFLAREQLGISMLACVGASMPQRDMWESHAVDGLIQRLGLAHQAVVRAALQWPGQADDAQQADRLPQHAHLHERLQMLLTELKGNRTPTLAMLCVAADDIATIARGMHGAVGVRPSAAWSGVG